MHTCVNNKVFSDGDSRNDSSEKLSKLHFMLLSITEVLFLTILYPFFSLNTSVFFFAFFYILNHSKLSLRAPQQSWSSTLAPSCQQSLQFICWSHPCWEKRLEVVKRKHKGDPKYNKNKNTYTKQKYLIKGGSK